MDTLTTNGVRISVDTFYQEQYSKPVERQFIFAYRITIDNLSALTVQLLRRHWIIMDSTGLVREVEGEGVVGQQPILHPGESHQYVSWCHLTTGMGRMHGTYLMQDSKTQRSFDVRVPQFRLVAPIVHN